MALSTGPGVAVGTVDTAIPVQWLENAIAGSAFVEPLTRIGRHLFDGRVVALRTGNFAFQGHIQIMHIVTSGCEVVV